MENKKEKMAFDDFYLWVRDNYKYWFEYDDFKNHELLKKTLDNIIDDIENKDEYYFIEKDDIIFDNEKQKNFFDDIEVLYKQSLFDTLNLRIEELQKNFIRYKIKNVDDERTYSPIEDKIKMSDLFLEYEGINVIKDYLNIENKKEILDELENINKYVSKIEIKRINNQLKEKKIYYKEDKDIYFNIELLEKYKDTVRGKNKLIDKANKMIQELEQRK